MTDQLQDKFAASATAQTDTLPRWDFTRFYPAPDCPAFEADFKQAQAMADAFAGSYEGKVATLGGAALAKAIEEFKAIDALLGKMGTFVQLKAVQDSKQFRPAEVSFNTRAAPLSSKLAFFTHEIKTLDEKTLSAAVSSTPALQVFAPWLESVRRAIPHTPPLAVRQYAGELAAESGWAKLYDDRLVAMKFPFEGKDLGMEEIMEVFTGDPDRARRAAAHKVFQDELNENGWLFAAVHNELMRLKDTDDRWSKFAQPWDARHFSNNVEPAVVDALESAVKNAYPRISHRFYALKAKLMGQDQLEIFDRNINVFAAGDKAYIPFAQARDTVLAAYRRFMTEMADAAQRFFDEGWIDAPTGPFKRGGAFAHPGGAALAHPMVMLNYQGSARDVATMAHELGHGVHQLLAAHKGDAIVETPLTLAETASVFGEMLTFKSLVAQAGSDDERRKLLFEKINDMVNTVCRQISFYDFEKRIHAAYRENQTPLSEDDFGKHWRDALRESYGDSIKVEDDYGAVFGYIPHFVHSPFYVYAYAFGDALVNALYRVYEEGSVPDFEKNYIKMLEAGGTLKPEDLKQMFGLDIRDPAFWDKGLKVIEDMIDELETLCQPLLKKDAAPDTTAPPPQP